MYQITEQDVRAIAAELTGKAASGDSALYAVLRKTSYLTIARACRESECLRGRGLEEDILHDVCVRVWTGAYRVLFTDGGVNADPKAFGGWLSAVTANRIRDYVRRGVTVRRNSVLPAADETARDVLERTPARPEADGEKEALINLAVNYVLRLSQSVHIALAWLAHTAVLLTEESEWHRASRTVAARYAECTLQFVFEDAAGGLGLISWFSLQPETVRHMRSVLAERAEHGASVGEMTFGSFFMKKGGEASVSDWVNRVNGRARRLLQKIEEAE